MEPDFCEYCGAQLVEAEKLVTVSRHRCNGHLLFQAVPARVCQRCGERYYSAAVVQEMDRLMGLPELEAPRVSVPVIALTPVD